MLLLTCLACAFTLTSCVTYIPPVYYGEPILAAVAELQAPDFRGEPVYLINFDMALNESGDVVSSLVHRHLNVKKSTSHTLLYLYVYLIHVRKSAYAKEIKSTDSTDRLWRE